METTQNYPTPEALQSLQSFTDEMTYRSYSYNRTRYPNTKPESWLAVFPDGAAYEARYQAEINMTAETCEVCGHVGKFGSLSDKDAEIVQAEYRTPTGHPGFRYECKNIDACLDRKSGVQTA